MKAIRLSGSYLKPITGAGIILIVFLFSELVSWAVSYSINLHKMQQVGGVLPYLGLLLRSLLIPKLTTVLLLVWLLNRTHRWSGNRNPLGVMSCTVPTQ